MVRAAILTAHEASIKAASGYWKQGQTEKGEEKGDPNVGSHAIVTKTDVGAQDWILENLHMQFPHAYFITEEKPRKKSSSGYRIITDKSLTYPILDNKIYGVDPLDGTSTFNSDLYEWSVSIGLRDEKGVHVGGGISAADVRGGLLAFGERGKGVFVQEGRYPPLPTKVRKCNVKGSMVYIGPDIFFLRQFSRFLNKFSGEVRTTNCNGSCALGLALVAAGKIDAFVQPVQCPWDWFAGYPLVEEAGGKFIFYHYGDRKNQRTSTIPTIIENPDILSYSSERRNVAIIAGQTDLVDWLFEQLQRYWIKMEQFELVERFFNALGNPDDELKIRKAFAEMKL
ncbi:MAG: hypothetical protein KGI72_01995 [Patescibacteria group bacterium]|nr:hypothetical protein [Patescibacteria group bacterium]